MDVQKMAIFDLSRGSTIKRKIGSGKSRKTFTRSNNFFKLEVLLEPTISIAEIKYKHD